MHNMEISSILVIYMKTEYVSQFIFSLSSTINIFAFSTSFNSMHLFLTYPIRFLLTYHICSFSCVMKEKSMWPQSSQYFMSSNPSRLSVDLTSVREIVCWFWLYTDMLSGDNVRRERQRGEWETHRQNVIEGTDRKGEWVAMME